MSIFDVWLGGRPTARAEMEKFAERACREAEDALKRQLGTNNLDDLTGGRADVFIELEIFGVDIDKLTTRQWEVRYPRCEPGWPIECQCYTVTWLESYTISVHYRLFLVYRYPTHSRRNPHHAGVHRFEVVDEAHGKTEIHCPGANDLEIPDNYASLGGRELIAALPARTFALTMAWPGEAIRGAVDVAIPSRVATTKRKEAGGTVVDVEILASRIERMSFPTPPKGGPAGDAIVAHLRDHHAELLHQALSALGAGTRGRSEAASRARRTRSAAKPRRR